jgi:MYXO-CTERM domain-containing protein
VENTVNGGVSCLQTTFGPLGAASNFYVTTKSELTSNQSDYHAVREVVGLPTDGYVCGNDQVILILTDDIDPNEAVPLVPRIDVPIAAGDEYYAVGYGGTNDSGAGAGARRRRDTLFVDCVAGDCPNYLVKDSEWLGDIGICHGDSGGPSLDLENRVIGVTSRGSVGCDSPVYGYVLTWAQWLKDTTVYATGLGGYPAPPWSTGYPTDPQYSMPIGDLCAVPADCKSNGCLHDGIGSYCTRLCNDAAPCPEGYTCDQENLGVCVRVYPDPVPLPADDEAGAETSCAVGRRPGADPTKPVPWLTIAVIAALARLRRRR